MNIRKITSLLILIFALFAPLTCFQNCAPKAVEKTTTAASLIPTNGSSANVTATCGTNLNTCTSGSLLNLADSATQYLWKCQGSGPTGSSTTCGINIGMMTSSGVCASEPNTCTTGLFFDLPDSSTQYVWRCDGSSGSATCGANKPTTALINGDCGDSNNACAKGVTFDLPDSTNQYLWRCDGVGIGAASESCAINITSGGGGNVVASCGIVNNACGTNNTLDNIADSATHYLWRCNGSPGSTTSCSIAKPVIGNCTLSAESLVHIGETIHFTIRPPNGVSIPNPVYVKFTGTKSALNGSGTVIDELGTNVISVDPNNFTYVHSDGAAAGIYNRSMTLINPLNNQEICKTNNITATMTPLCGLTVTPLNLTTDQTTVTTLALPVAGQPSLAAAPTQIAWYGSKTVNGVNDPAGAENGSFKMATNLFPFTAGYTESHVGVYLRYYKALDANNRELCKSPIVQIVLEAPASPPPSNDGGGN